MASKGVRKAKQAPKAKKKIGKMDHGKRAKQKLAVTKAKANAVKQIEKEIIPTEAELGFDDVELEEEFNDEVMDFEEYVEDMSTVDPEEDTLP